MRGRIGGMDEPQFSLADMLRCVGLLAVAFGLMMFCGQYHYSYPATGILLLLVPPCIGAGMGALYQRMISGMLWGLLAVIPLLVVLLPWLQAARE